MQRLALETDVVEDIGQKLLNARLIDAEALAKAALQQKNTGGTLIGNLVKTGALSEQELLDFLSQVYHVQSADLSSYEPDPVLTKLIPGDVATKFMALPIARAGRKLTVAMANPSNIFAIDDIKFITGYEVEPRVAFEVHLKKSIDRAYDSAGTMADVMKGMEEDLAVVEEEDTDIDAGIAAARSA